MGRGRVASGRGLRRLKSFLDTHFLLWLVVGSARLEKHPWLDRYRPWGISPISLLEVQLLAEFGRLELDAEGFLSRVADDPRFVLDEAPLIGLIRHAFRLEWTRDPFDRLLAAHSASRRVPLCTVDRTIRSNHRYLPPDQATAPYGRRPSASPVQARTR